MLNVLVLMCYECDTAAFMGGSSGWVLSRCLLHP
jgi:hypothetical protein